MYILKFIVLIALTAVCIMPLHINAMSDKKMSATKAEAVQDTGIMLRTDDESIGTGKEIFDSKCYFCHDARSTKKGVGPGMKGILKVDKFPVSEMAATPENVVKQLRTPYKSMPSFSSLSDEDILNIIAYLNTL